MKKGWKKLGQFSRKHRGLRGHLITVFNYKMCCLNEDANIAKDLHNLCQKCTMASSILEFLLRPSSHQLWLAEGPSHSLLAPDGWEVKTTVKTLLGGENTFGMISRDPHQGFYALFLSLLLFVPVKQRPAIRQFLFLELSCMAMKDLDHRKSITITYDLLSLPSSNYIFSVLLSSVHGKAFSSFPMNR